MTLPRLTIGITSTDRTRAIIDGRITLPGFDLDLRIDEPQPLFRASHQRHELAVSELSLGTHLLETASGRSAYVGIPVFLSRAFRHGSIYVRSDRGIRSPADLAGKRVGIQGLQQTITLWVRGILADHYALDLGRVTWVVGGLEKPGSLERIALNLPPKILVEEAGPGQTLDALLRDGALDAVISPAPPPCFGKPDVPVMRLFSDPAAEEAAYFRVTGLFPLMHLLGVRADVVEAWPDLPAALFTAFARAKSFAQGDLLRLNYLRASLPWAAEEAHRTRRLMGPNPWRYGLASNLPELAAIIRYAHDDGLIARQIDPGMLFHPATHALPDPDDSQRDEPR